jgi:hypothetical protein
MEGSFLVHKVIGPGSYRLQYYDGQKVPTLGISSTYGVFTLSQLVSHVVSCGVAWPIGGALLLYFQYYSIYWFMTSTTWSLLHELCSHTSNTTPFTGLRLVLCGVYCMGFAPILLVLLRLLVYDCYYIEFTAWASLPYFQYNSVYWFTTGIRASLLKGSRSHRSSNAQVTSFWLIFYMLLMGSRTDTYSTTPFIGLRLVLRGVYCMGFAPIIPVQLRLLVHDWYSCKFTEGALLP